MLIFVADFERKNVLSYDDQDDDDDADEDEIVRGDEMIR